MALLRLRRSFCESREMRWQLIKFPMALSFQSVVSTFQTGVETSSFFPRFLAGVGSYSLLSPLARSRENRVCGKTDRIHTIIQGDEFNHKVFPHLNLKLVGPSKRRIPVPPPVLPRSEGGGDIGPGEKGKSPRFGAPFLLLPSNPILLPCH